MPIYINKICTACHEEINPNEQALAFIVGGSQRDNKGWLIIKSRDKTSKVLCPICTRKMLELLEES